MQVLSKCLSAFLNARIESVKRSGGSVFQNTEVITEDDCLIFCCRSSQFLHSWDLK